MKQDDIAIHARRILETVAPDAADKELRADANLRDQLEFDSLDFLNFVTALQREFKVAIPEMDYPKLSSLEGCVQYLARKLELTPPA